MDIVEQEEWRAIPGQLGYEASNLGSIRSLDRVVIIIDGDGRVKHTRELKGRLLKPCVGGHGYLVVEVSGQSHYVHRLVATAFIGLISPGFEVNHKDGNKLNCRYGNIEIVTPKGNNHHARDNGLIDTRGESHGASKLSNEDVSKIRAAIGKTLRELGAEFGVSHSVISEIRSGKAWKHVMP